MKSLKYLLSGFCTIAILASTNSATAAEFKASDDPLAVVSQLQTQKKPTSQREKDAEELAIEYIKDNKLPDVWDDKNKQMVAYGVSMFDVDDPAYDNSYVTARSLMATEAQLLAKAKIIESVSLKMSASNFAKLPGTDLNAKFGKQLKDLELKIEGQKQKLAKLLEQQDAAEADDLRGATLEDRLPALMDAAITKLDETYSPDDIKDEKTKRYLKAKEKYEKARQEHKVLQKKLDAAMGSIRKELTSEVEIFAKMPLFGAVTIAQFESWNEDNDQYKVAMVVIWSKKMNEIVRAMIKGEKLQVPPGPVSLTDWLHGQNWCSSLGGRRFRDEQGKVWFIGISAVDVGYNSADEEDARNEAELFAMQEVAMSIFSNVVSHKIAKRKGQVKSAGVENKTIAGSSSSRMVREDIKDRPIQGLNNLYSQKCTHPISQRELYVSIYGMSQDSAIGAMRMQESNYITAILDVTAQQVLKGREAGQEAEVTKAKQDSTAYNEAAQISGEKVRKKADAEVAPVQSNLATAQGQDETTDCPQGETCSKKKKAQSGSTAGAGQSDASW